MQVASASEVIDALGGPTKFAEWWGAQPDTVSAWRKRGFPAKTFYSMRRKLRDEKQIDVDPAAWGQQ